MADIDALLKSIRRTRNFGYGLGTGLSLFGAGTIVGAIAGDMPTGGRVGLGILGLCSLAVGVAMFVLQGVRNHRPIDSPFVTKIYNQPDRVVWVFVHEIASQLGGRTVKQTRYVFLCTTDGKQHQLAVANSRLSALMELLRARFPHATFGHSRELAKQFGKNPEALRIYTGQAGAA